jgi:hypothetical protein
MLIGRRVCAHDVSPDESACDCGARPTLDRLLLSSTISPPSHDHREETMALEEAVDILKVLTPIAKAVPILGAPVEGSLEALSKILEFAQARRSHIDLASPSSFRLSHRE